MKNLFWEIMDPVFELLENEIISHIILLFIVFNISLSFIRLLGITKEIKVIEKSTNEYAFDKDDFIIDENEYK